MLSMSFLHRYQIIGWKENEILYKNTNFCLTETNASLTTLLHSGHILLTNTFHCLENRELFN